MSGEDVTVTARRRLCDSMVEAEAEADRFFEVRGGVSVEVAAVVVAVPRDESTRTEAGSGGEGARLTGNRRGGDEKRKLGCAESGFDAGRVIDKDAAESTVTAAAT